MYGSLCKCTRPAGICPRALLADAAAEDAGTADAAVVGQLAPQSTSQIKELESPLRLITSGEVD